MKDIFIIGSKGIPSNYGGFETFVDNLVSRQVNKDIKYHIACITFDKKVKCYNYNGAECQEITVPNIGGAKAILYDLRALNWALDSIKKNKLNDGVIYILACRIGPFLAKYKKKFILHGFKIYVNPDGHEWKRAKWSYPVRKYWKLSERLMVRSADLLICDSKSIEEYIKDNYRRYDPKTTFIAYGADISNSKLSIKDKEVSDWFKNKKVTPNEYFLVVGRFVPENNLETIIKEFMSSNVEKDLVIITNIEKNKFYNELLNKTDFTKDKRIKFVGTVYNQELLKYIREKSFAYIHGHSVGGTNPSLLEALGETKLNLLYDVGFNREVGLNGAIYWKKEFGYLMRIIEMVDKFGDGTILEYSRIAKKRISDEYLWTDIVKKYETILDSRKKDVSL